MKIIPLILFVGCLITLQRCTPANSAQMVDSESAMNQADMAKDLEPEVEQIEVVVEQPKEYTWTYPKPWLDKSIERFYGEFEGFNGDSVLTRISIFSVDGKLCGTLESNPYDSACVVKEISVLGVNNCAQLGIEIGDSLSQSLNSSTILTFQGDSMALDVTHYSEVRFSYEHEKYARINSSGVHVPSAKEPLDFSKFDVAFSGEQDNYTFPAIYETKEWFAVFSGGSSTSVFPAELAVGTLGMYEEMNGYYMEKEIKAHEMRSVDFLVTGIPSNWISENHKGGRFERKEFSYGDWNNIDFPESDWRIIQTGQLTDYDCKNTELVLMGTKNGRSITQIIDKQEFREYPATYRWVGDLDGDGYPDFIFNVSPKGYEDLRLYLSSEADENNLVKESAEFLTTQLGC